MERPIKSHAIHLLLLLKSCLFSKSPKLKENVLFILYLIPVVFFNCKTQYYHERIICVLPNITMEQLIDGVWQETKAEEQFRLWFSSQSDPMGHFGASQTDF